VSAEAKNLRYFFKGVKRKKTNNALGRFWVGLRFLLAVPGVSVRRRCVFQLLHLQQLAAYFDLMQSSSFFT